MRIATGEISDDAPALDPAKEHMRLCDLLDLSGRERRQRGLGTGEATVHQLVAAKLDRELGATPHQAQFPDSAGNARGVDFYPRNHAVVLEPVIN